MFGNISNRMELIIVCMHLNVCGTNGSIVNTSKYEVFGASGSFCVCLEHVKKAILITPV